MLFDTHRLFFLLFTLAIVVVMIIIMIIITLIGGGDYDDDEGDYFDNDGDDCLLDVCSNVEGFPAKERGNCLIHDRVILVEIFYCFCYIIQHFPKITG